VDTSCYCIKTDVLTKVSHRLNIHGWGEDRIFYKALSEQFPNFGCTGLNSVNYRNERLKQMFLDGNEVTKELYNDKYPWRN
jgi:hypothetical protein